MTDARILLERHRPRLVYDSHEAYFADSAATWTDSPTNVLRRADGTVLAKPPQLSLALLGPHAYADGASVLADRRDRRHDARLRRPRRRVASPGEVQGPGLRPRAARQAEPAVAPVLALLLLQRLPAARPVRRRQARGRLGARPAPSQRRRATGAGGLLAAQDRREQAVGEREEGRDEHAARLRRPRFARELLQRGLGTRPRPGSTRPTARARRSRRRSRCSRTPSRRGCTGPACGGTRRRRARRSTPRARSAPAAARTG